MLSKYFFRMVWAEVDTNKQKNRVEADHRKVSCIIFMMNIFLLVLDQGLKI